MNAAFDRAELIDAVLRGNTTLLKDLLRIFFRQYPGAIAETERAVSGNDLHEIEGAAHNLKNIAGNFCAGKAFALAERLETGVRGGSLSGASETWQELKSEMDRLHDELKLLLDELA